MTVSIRRTDRNYRYPNGKSCVEVIRTKDIFVEILSDYKYVTISVKGD